MDKELYDSVKWKMSRGMTKDEAVNWLSYLASRGSITWVTASQVATRIVIEEERRERIHDSRQNHKR